MVTLRMPYRDRRHAGQVLAEQLDAFRERQDVLVLALPRGGVPVAYEVAHSLHAPLDVFIVRKLGFPGCEEYAIGAIASGGTCVMNPEAGPMPERELAAIVARETVEVERRERLYRGTQPPVRVAGRTVIVVDDGLATGSTMRAAVEALRALSPARIVAAVPVGAGDTVQRLRTEADEVVCPSTPSPFRAVGLWYSDFPQTSDDEVRALLERAHEEHALAAH